MLLKASSIASCGGGEDIGGGAESSVTGSFGAVAAAGSPTLLRPQGHQGEEACGAAGAAAMVEVPESTLADPGSAAGGAPSGFAAFAADGEDTGGTEGVAVVVICYLSCSRWGLVAADSQRDQLEERRGVQRLMHCHQGAVVFPRLRAIQLRHAAPQRAAFVQMQLGAYCLQSALLSQRAVLVEE